MPWAVVCTDRSDIDTDALRRLHRDAHFGYIESILERLLVAGPMIDPASGQYRSSLFIYRADNEDEARRLLENDPYFRAGIYERITYQSFVPAAGAWIGGTIWTRDADGSIVIPKPPSS